MSEETHTINVVYNIQNINDSIKSTQRMLYFTNALRLSIVDIQQVMAGPTISNVMWTAVQLTRVWTNLYRIISRTNQAQAAGIGIGATRGVLGGRAGAAAARGFAAGQTTLTGGTLGGTALSAALLAFIAANPVLAAGAAITLTVSALGYRKFFMDRRLRNDRREFITRQREIAKSQGYEY